MNIVLGVAGGIAAYKACNVLRLLREQGHSVKVVPTANALKFVGAATFEALSGQPVSTDVFDDVDTVAHVAIGRGADLVIVAPATADLLSRARTGSAGDLLTATLLTATCPVVLVPAMHTEMWYHPAVVDNVATLRKRGTIVMEPASGRLTGKDTGPGRLPEPEDIVAFALSHAGAEYDRPRAHTAGETNHTPGETRPEGEPAVRAGQPAGTSATTASAAETAPAAPAQPFAGRTIMISAGGTREPLDPVRFLGNRSSGKQGVALAAAASELGARVELIAANVSAEVLAELPANAQVTHVETTAQLRTVCLDKAQDADCIIMAAAVADYRPKEAAAHKIKKSGDEGLTLELVQNPDILRELVAAHRGQKLIVGFAAETGSQDTPAEEFARQKLLRKGCDAIVFNSVAHGATFGADETEVTVFKRAGDQAEPIAHVRGTKSQVSRAVMKALAALQAG